MLTVFNRNLYTVGFIRLIIAKLISLINTALSTILDLFEAGHVTKNTQ